MPITSTPTVFAVSLDSLYCEWPKALRVSILGASVRYFCHVAIGGAATMFASTVYSPVFLMYKEHSECPLPSYPLSPWTMTSFPAVFATCGAGNTYFGDDPDCKITLCRVVVFTTPPEGV